MIIRSVGDFFRARAAAIESTQNRKKYTNLQIHSVSCNNFNLCNNFNTCDNFNPVIIASVEIASYYMEPNGFGS